MSDRQPRYYVVYWQDRDLGGEIIYGADRGLLYFGRQSSNAFQRATVAATFQLNQIGAKEYVQLTRTEFNEFVDGPYLELCFYMDEVGHEIWVEER